MTGPGNIKLLQALNKENGDSDELKAAKKRLSKSTGTEDERIEDQKIVDTHKARKAIHTKLEDGRLVLCLDRREAGDITEADTKYIDNALKASLARAQYRTEGKNQQLQKPSRKSRPKRPPQREKNHPPLEESDEGLSDGDSSSDDEDGEKGKDLVGSQFEDGGHICSVSGHGVDGGGYRVLFYDFKGEEEHSAVAEVRGWVDAYSEGQM
jgi:hypothetical protein